MIKSALGKVMWVGRATVFVVGLAVILAMVVGVASAAFGANLDNFIIGNGINNTTKNIASLTSRLTMGGTASAPGLQVTQQSTGTGASGVGITVPSGKAPIKVNSAAGKATNLNADKLDGQDSTEIGRELWVVMNESGGVVRSRGVIVASSRKLNTGSYLVTFDRDVSNCAYVASPSNSFNVVVSPRNGANPNEVGVHTLFQGTLADAPFHLIVAC
jgi:hypothetical protein